MWGYFQQARRRKQVTNKSLMVNAQNGIRIRTIFFGKSNLTCLKAVERSNLFSHARKYPVVFLP